jgi:hypothetical protein
MSFWSRFPCFSGQSLPETNEKALDDVCPGAEMSSKVSGATRIVWQTPKEPDILYPSLKITISPPSLAPSPQPTPAPSSPRQSAGLQSPRSKTLRRYKPIAPSVSTLLPNSFSLGKNALQKEKEEEEAKLPGMIEETLQQREVVRQCEIAKRPSSVKHQLRSVEKHGN